MERNLVIWQKPVKQSHSECMSESKLIQKYQKVTIFFGGDFIFGQAVYFLPLSSCSKIMSGVAMHICLFFIFFCSGFFVILQNQKNVYLFIIWLIVQWRGKYVDVSCTFACSIGPDELLFKAVHLANITASSCCGRKPFSAT